MPVILPSLAITPWARMYPDVIRHIQQAPIQEIDDAIRKAARRFCRDSHCWRERNLTLLTTVADQADYTYNLSAEAELLRVHAAWDGDVEVDVTRPGEGDDRDPSYADSTWAVDVAGPATLRVSPLPETAGVVLKGSLSFIPSTNATGILTTIFDEWREEIAGNAVAMLAAQPGKPWTNPAIVGFHQQLFESGVHQASNQAGPVRRKPIRVKPW